MQIVVLIICVADASIAKRRFRCMWLLHHQMALLVQFVFLFQK
jgi:hypothetical protein